MALVGYATPDAHADLIIGSTKSTSPDVATPWLLTILTGDGSGGLSAPSGPYQFTAPPLVLGDVDNDGATDVAAGHRIATDAVATAFNEVVTLPRLNADYHWSDVNGDGQLDFVATSLSTIEVGLGRGDGTFSDAISSPISVPYMRDGALVDYDGDDHLDLVGLRFRPTEPDAISALEVLPGDGAGQFRDAGAQSLNAFVERLTFGDFNCDGASDLVLVRRDGTVEMRLAADGGWPSGYEVITLRGPTGTIPLATSAIVADVNGDGAHDIVSAARTAPPNNPKDEGRVTVHWGDGRGAFAGSTDLLTDDAGMLPTVLAAGDLDGDQKDEIVALDITVDQLISIWFPQ
jgi:hypothetical protein